MYVRVCIYAAMVVTLITNSKKSIKSISMKKEIMESQNVMVAKQKVVWIGKSM